MASRTTKALLPLCAILAIWTAPVSAQDSPGHPPRPRPADHSIAVGIGNVVEDGESSFRASLFWYASDRFVAGLTTNWGLVDNIEPELRWFPLTRSSPLFLSGSVICKDLHCGRLGGSVAAGAEVYPTRFLSWSASLGWESVYARSGPFDGPYWLRIQLIVSVVFPSMTPE